MQCILKHMTLISFKKNIVVVGDANFPAGTIFIQFYVVVVVAIFSKPAPLSIKNDVFFGCISSKLSSQQCWPYINQTCAYFLQ